MAKKILLFALFFQIAAGQVAGEELLSRKLSVSFRDTPIRQALDEVAKLADFEWSYNTGILDQDRRVTFTARDWTVRETLQEILGEGYAFKSSGRYLILKKQKPPKRELSGVVRDPKTGERLANATIYDRKTLRATTTDSSGYYRLKVKKNAEIVVARLGYRDTVLQVTSLTPRYQRIELSPVMVPEKDSANLSEKWRQALKKTATELESFFAATGDVWHDLNVPDTLQRRFQISFLPMLGTNHVLSGKVENQVSVNVLAGTSAGVRGVEAAGLGNFTKNRVAGVQAAGLFNVNKGDCHGVQAAGLFNQTADTLVGAQFAGLVNVAHHSPQFFLQAAGLVNVVRRTGGAPESAPLDTLAPRGIQVSGLVNSADQLEGVQVAGLVNRARRIHGIQVGVFNTADHLEGLQIGLLNRSGKRWLPFINWGK